MPAIRCVEIAGFRAIKAFRWAPSPGVNGLFGPGDSGKSTILEAIEMVLLPRRTAVFTDADFHRLDVSSPIVITATIGDLPEEWQDIDRYGLFLRGWDPDTKTIEDEPGAGQENVLSIRLLVESDLDPKWFLFSVRADEDGQRRDLSWAERTSLAPSRLGAPAAQHLSWGPRSILNRVTEERADANLALAEAARLARTSFGDKVREQVPATLEVVQQVAGRLGVRISGAVQATLDAHAASLTAGAISLHDGTGVPLRNLGLGSSRLMVAGLHAEAASASPIVLADEVEHGLKPYRLIRLLHVLGAKASEPRQQILLTTHSPVALRELSADQLWLVRGDTDGHVRAHPLGEMPDCQGTVRSCAEAFLAPSVLVCEGATEVGLVRGLDLYWTDHGLHSLASHGVFPCDGGGNANMLDRARAFALLGYRTALLHDSDDPLNTRKAAAAVDAGVSFFCWEAGCSTEQQLFRSLPSASSVELLRLATETRGEDGLRDQIHNHSKGAFTLLDCIERFHDDMRHVLGMATKRAESFKRVEYGERVGREILGPALDSCGGHLGATANSLRAWIVGASQGDLSGPFGGAGI